MHLVGGCVDIGVLIFLMHRHPKGQLAVEADGRADQVMGLADMSVDDHVPARLILADVDPHAVYVPRPRDEIEFGAWLVIIDNQVFFAPACCVGEFAVDDLEVANVIKFLASPEAGYVIGQLVVVDGGNTIQEYKGPRKYYY